MRSVRGTDDIQYRNRASAAFGSFEGYTGDGERAKQPKQQAAPAGAAIVGFWHVKFISKGTGFIPDALWSTWAFRNGTRTDRDSELFAASCDQQFLPGRWEKTGSSPIS